MWGGQAKESSESAYLGERDELYSRLTNSNEQCEVHKGKIAELEKMLETSHSETKQLKASID
eukprot:scaffold647897_cov39-Prasinocladus_malaysianus.AAC.1